jgi:hypothetical protein
MSSPSDEDEFFINFLRQRCPVLLAEIAFLEIEFGGLVSGLRSI